MGAAGTDAVVAAGGVAAVVAGMQAHLDVVMVQECIGFSGGRKDTNCAGVAWSWGCVSETRVLVV